MPPITGGIFQLITGGHYDYLPPDFYPKVEFIGMPSLEDICIANLTPKQKTKIGIMKDSFPGLFRKVTKEQRDLLSEIIKYVIPALKYPKKEYDKMHKNHPSRSYKPVTCLISYMYIGDLDNKTLRCLHNRRANRSYTPGYDKKHEYRKKLQGIQLSQRRAIKYDRKRKHEREITHEHEHDNFNENLFDLFE